MKRCGGWAIVWKKSIDKVRGSLTVRIFLITALILAATCGVTYGFLAWATPISYFSVVSDELDDRTASLIANLEQTTLEESGPLLDAFMVQTGSTVLVHDESGTLVDLPVSIGISHAVDAQKGYGEAVLQSGSYYVSSFSGRTDGSTADTVVTVTEDLSGGFPFHFQNDETVYFLQAAYTAKSANQATEAMGRVLPYLILVGLAISLLGAVFYSRYITRPIVRLSAISQKMADLDFSRTCGEIRGDEIGQLGRNLDALSQRLSAALEDLRSANEALRRDIDRERALERQRATFFSAASHELKTPITILKGQLSGMLAGVDVYQDRDKYLAKSLAAASRMEALVQEILAVSRMERADFEPRRESLDLSALVERQAALLTDLTEQRRQVLSVSVVPGLRIFGDRALLEKAAANLLNNASTHSPQGGRITVELAPCAAGPVLTVSNTGACLPEESLPRLFEAFYRVDASRNRSTGGSGLGLYLVKLILDRHGADCRMENTAEGVRATVQFGVGEPLPPVAERPLEFLRGNL